MAKQRKKKSSAGHKVRPAEVYGQSPTEDDAKTKNTEKIGWLRSHTRLSGSAIVLIVTAVIAVHAVTTKKQLLFLDGMAEDYFRLGINLHQTGRFHRYADDMTHPFTFRPPGYAVFLAGIIKLTDLNLNGLEDGSESRRDGTREEMLVSGAIKATCIVQALLLSLSSALLFLWLSRYVAVRNAFIMALLYGCNPYLIIHAGFLHYEILHLTLTIASCYALDASLQAKRNQHLKLAMAGMLWGATTLVRPQTLLLPPFLAIIVMLYIKCSGRTFKAQFKDYWQPVLVKTGLVIFGMALIISPWTFRNYRVAGKIIPINSQSWNVVWASTVNVVERTPNHFRWWSTWYPYGMPVFEAVTGSAKFNYRDFITHQHALEEAFKKETIKNLLHQPDIYLHNMVLHGVSFVLDINSVMIKFYQAIQEPNIKFSKKWLWVGDPQNFYSSSAAKRFEIFTTALTFLSFIGAGLGILGKERWLIAPGLIFVLFWASHTLTYLDIFYYYIKLPFLYVFSAYAIQAMKKKSLAMKKIPLDILVNGFLFIYCFALLVIPILW
jgi:hypothetical protein